MKLTVDLSNPNDVKEAIAFFSRMTSGNAGANAATQQQTQQTVELDLGGASEDPLAAFDTVEEDAFAGLGAAEPAAPTVDDVIKELQELAKRKGKDVAQKAGQTICKNLGVSKLSEIPADKFPAVIAAFKKIA